MRRKPTITAKDAAEANRQYQEKSDPAAPNPAQPTLADVHPTAAAAQSTPPSSQEENRAAKEAKWKKRLGPVDWSHAAAGLEQKWDSAAKRYTTPPVANHSFKTQWKQPPNKVLLTLAWRHQFAAAAKAFRKLMRFWHYRDDAATFAFRAWLRNEELSARHALDPVTELRVPATLFALIRTLPDFVANPKDSTTIPVGCLWGLPVVIDNTLSDDLVCFVNTSSPT